MLFWTIFGERFLVQNVIVLKHKVSLNCILEKTAYMNNTVKYQVITPCAVRHNTTREYACACTFAGGIYLYLDTAIEQIKYDMKQ